MDERLQLTFTTIGNPLQVKMINVLLEGKVSYMELGFVRKEIQEVEGIAMVEFKYLAHLNGLR